MKNLFVLAYADYDTYIPYYLTGPEDVSQLEFKTLCDSLLEEAGFLAIKNSIEKIVEDQVPMYVGWNEIVQSIIPLLEKQGFNVFDAKTAVYIGSEIINSDDHKLSLFGKAKESIIDHNDMVKQSYH